MLIRWFVQATRHNKRKSLSESSESELASYHLLFIENDENCDEQKKNYAQVT